MGANSSILKDKHVGMPSSFLNFSKRHSLSSIGSFAATRIATPMPHNKSTAFQWRNNHLSTFSDNQTTRKVDSATKVRFPSDALRKISGSLLKNVSWHAPRHDRTELYRTNRGAEKRESFGVSGYLNQLPMTRS